MVSGEHSGGRVAAGAERDRVAEGVTWTQRWSVWVRVALRQTLVEWGHAGTAVAVSVRVALKAQRNRGRVGGAVWRWRVLV